MNESPRVGRGLRYLCLDQYRDSSPELVTANIIKLQLLQSFDLDIVQLPTQPGFPHDGAVRIPQEVSEPERLIWFDFLVLLQDQPGTASRYGTITMAQAGNTSPPAFYIILFPDSPDYVAILPHAVAWWEGESDCYDITGTGITGPYFPYLMPKHLVSLAFDRISLIPWGSIYTNPGTGVVLKRWFPVMTESPRDSPAAPLFVEGWSSAPLPLDSATKKRRRDSDAEDDTTRLAPALREATSGAALLLGDIQGQEFDGTWAELDLFDPNWPFSDQSGLSILPGSADQALQAADLVEAQHALEHIYPVSPQHDNTDIPGRGQADDMGYHVPEMWNPAPKGLGEVGHEEVSRWVADCEVLLPSSQSRPSGLGDLYHSRQASSLRAIAPAPLATEADRPFPTSAPVDSPSEVKQSSKPVVVGSETGVSVSESDDDEEDAPPCRLVELHPEHPWCNHIYLPPSTQDILTQLLAEDTVCLPVASNPSDNIDGSPMPLSMLSTAHPCLHILSSRQSSDTFFLLPSRWVDFFQCSLNQLLNSTSGESKRSALRGTNKIITENPTVADAFNRYGIEGVEGSAALRWGLWDEWVREFKRKTPLGMTREEDRNACCRVRDVLQVQVDWSTRLFPEF